MDFPEHAFWDFSLAFYRKPGVADACLYLQDQYGLNVNILLLCIWSGKTTDGPLTTMQLEACTQRIRDWEEKVIQPLRAIRRAVRHETLGVPEFIAEAFHLHVESSELEAEHVEQLMLADLVAGAGVIDNPEPAPVVLANLQAYIAIAGVHQEPQFKDCLDTLIRAACPGTEFVFT
ncbi:MAG: TIGR02444 family protein [Gammaproteobacteria bacterium]|nr:TIGR02444 family protein [Gammaproteobacteria bacterium]